MIHVPCNTCQFSDECPKYNAMARTALYAWLDGKIINCDDHQPDFFHGIEGVFA